MLPDLNLASRCKSINVHLACVKSGKGHLATNTGHGQQPVRPKSQRMLSESLDSLHIECFLRLVAPNRKLPSRFLQFLECVSIYLVALKTKHTSRLPELVRIQPWPQQQELGPNCCEPVVAHVYWLDLLVIVLPVWGIVTSFFPPIRSTVGLVASVSGSAVDVVA